MEEQQEKDDHSTSFSWWSNSHNRPYQSQWLQVALSDLESKTNMIVNIIQDDGESFVKRAEMFYKRRTELINLVQDLHKSYRSLAEKYDQLRSECVRVSHLRSLSLSSSLNSSIESPPTNDHLDAEGDHNSRPGGLVNEPMSCKQCKKEQMNQEIDRNISERALETVVDGINLNGNIDCGEKIRIDCPEGEKTRNELRLQVSELMEDSLRQQGELVKRNEEKREVIKHLRAQINRLMEENRTLRSHLPSYKVVDVKRGSSKFHLSKLKGLNCIGKFQT